VFDLSDLDLDEVRVADTADTAATLERLSLEPMVRVTGAVADGRSCSCSGSGNCLTGCNGCSRSINGTH
jgi:hypothetical protein